MPYPQKCFLYPKLRSGKQRSSVIHISQLLPFCSFLAHVGLRWAAGPGEQDVDTHSWGCPLWLFGAQDDKEWALLGRGERGEQEAVVLPSPGSARAPTRAHSSLPAVSASWMWRAHRDRPGFESQPCYLPRPLGQGRMRTKWDGAPRPLARLNPPRVSGCLLTWHLCIVPEACTYGALTGYQALCQGLGAWRQQPGGESSGLSIPMPWDSCTHRAPCGGRLWEALGFPRRRMLIRNALAKP